MAYQLLVSLVHLGTLPWTHSIARNATEFGACMWHCGHAPYHRAHTHTNHTFTTKWSYTHVSGRVRGYHSVITGNLGAFYPGTINDRYADGVLITSEIPRRHLWTYAVGTPRKRNYSLCTNESRLPVLTGIPGFVRNDSYCEDRPTNTTTIAWQDPLWTKKHGCIANNTSCLGYGWFHKKVNHTSDSIEVRWCTREGAVYTDIVEIWVL